MSRANYDEAYESESKRYPAIFRMSDTNKKIIIIFVGIYVLLNVALAILVGFASVPLMLYMFGSIVVNIAIMLFIYNALSGNINDMFQGYAMVAVPIWAVAIFVVPGLRTIPNMVFVLPLAWIEVMLIVEKRIQTAAQRRANTLDELEREHNRRETARAYDNAARGETGAAEDVPGYGLIKGRDAKYCPVCGIELGPDDTECPMCGPQ